MSSASVRAKLRELLDPVVGTAGFDLEDVTVAAAGRRTVVRVIIDGDGGVSLDAVADAASAVSAFLDEHDVVPGAYVLEVSSPGVDRPLTEARHWRRSVGRLVSVSAAGTALTGRLLAADDNGVTLDVGSVLRRLPFAELGRGRVEVEFSRPAAADSAEPTDVETAAPVDAP